MKKIPAVSQKFLFYCLGVLCLFVAGYFLFHAKEAAASGSWKYIITHGDEYGYWAFAKGASETPPNEGNPFYYEEMGLRQTMPFPVCTVTGWAAKVLNVPVLFFYPIWHIGMPFFLWLFLFVCLRKIWKYPAGASAAAAIILLLSTLYIRGQGQFILFRYSRPGDGLGLLFLWISLAMNLESRIKLKVTLAAAAAALSLWLHPYYVFAGILVTLPEGLWQFFAAKNKKAGLGLMSILATVGLAGLTYLIYVMLNIHQTPWTTQQISANTETEVSWLSSILLYGTIIVLIVISKKIFGRISKMDRLLLFVFLLEPISANFQAIAKASYTIANHRYYFLLLELACLAGWFAEKIPELLKHERFKKIEWPLAAVCLIAEIMWISSPRLNYFMYGPCTTPVFRAFDNATLLFELIPLFYLIFWPVYRFEKIRKIILAPVFVIALIIIMTVPGFALLKSQLKEETRQGKRDRPFPFDGAYRWLNANAKKNEVVLTLRAVNGYREDYLILYTDQKTYYNQDHAQLVAVDPDAKKYRKYFQGFLITGLLDKAPLQGLRTMPEKIKHLRLDFLLIEKPSLALFGIYAQLKDYLTEVYQDEHCILLRVQTPL